MAIISSTAHPAQPTITGTDPVEIARRNLWPAMAGFVGVIIVAIFPL
jgi:hypothetical protein